MPAKPIPGSTARNCTTVVQGILSPPRPRTKSSSTTAPAATRPCRARCTCRAGMRRAVRHPRRQHGPGDGIQRPRRLPEALRRAWRAPPSTISSSACGRRATAWSRPSATSSPGATLELRAPQVVIENGTVPMTETFDALRAGSINGGITDIDALLDGEPQRPTPPTGGLRAAPHRRRRHQPQRPRRHLRCSSPLHGPVGSSRHEQRSESAHSTSAETTLRPMHAGDLVAMHGLAQQMSWPHRPEDCAQLLALGRAPLPSTHGAHGPGRPALELRPRRRHHRPGPGRPTSRARASAAP